MMRWLLSRNPTALLQLALIAMVFGVCSGGWAAWKVQGARLEAANAKYDTFVAKVKIEGEAAAVAAKLVEEKHQQTVKEINNAWTTQLPKIRDSAVRNYIAHSMPVNPSGGSLPSSTNSSQGVDGASKECLPDTGFIQDAAEDAMKIKAWQDWATRNELPVAP